MLCTSLADRQSPDSVPFNIGFNMVKLSLVLPNKIVSDDQRLNIGLCLPYTCTAKDVQTLVELSIQDDHNNSLSVSRKAQVMNVRSPHNHYSVWEDTTFWILIGVTAFVLIMIFFGTLYDLHLQSKGDSSAKFLHANCKYEIAQMMAACGDGKTTRLDLGDQCINNNDLNGCQLKQTVVIENDKDSNSIPNGWYCQTKGIFPKMLLSFSVRINMLTICDQDVGSDTLPTIHGLRSMSMVWVILGHTCLVAFKYADNASFRGEIEKEFLFQSVTNATFSVDTFFFISGLLVSFLYFRTLAKVDIHMLTRSTGTISNIMQFLGLLVYRYFRLTVPYMYILGVVQVSMKWFYHNAVFEPPTLDHVNCPNYWWRNAFYINTLFPVKDMCMLWSWYLADDTQFYVLGAVLLILATSHFRLAAFTTATFLASSWFTTAFIAYSNKHIPSVDDPLALFDKIYDKPWTRLGPYLIGMCVGWILFKTDCKIKMNKLVVTLGWLLSTLCMLSLIFGLYNVELHAYIAAAYSSLSHSAWALGLSWVVIACSTGHGGYITKLLSLTILYPFSRVTYCAYLVHPLVIRIVPMMTDSPLHLTKESVFILFLGQLVASYVLAFAVSLAFEAPVVSMLKLLAPEKKEKKTQDECT